MPRSQISTGSTMTFTLRTSPPAMSAVDTPLTLLRTGLTSSSTRRRSSALDIVSLVKLTIIRGFMLLSSAKTTGSVAFDGRRDLFLSTASFTSSSTWSMSAPSEASTVTELRDALLSDSTQSTSPTPLTASSSTSETRVSTSSGPAPGSTVMTTTFPRSALGR